MHQQDTIVALATANGAGAIAIIRLSGPRAIDIVNAHFPAQDLNTVPSHTVHFGTFRDAQQNIIDEVLATVFKGPNSYTGEDVVELSCHGSSYILQTIIDTTCKSGARLAKAGEFTQRAFLNGKMDLSQAEAVADVIAAENAASHSIAIQQMRGGFSNRLKDLRQELIDFAALVELELDFAEEDVAFVDTNKLVELIYTIRKEIQALAESFRLGNAIKNGVNTVIVGRPNAGKSTLLNALLNEERAIVSDIAGTTRDTIEEELNVDGVSFRLIDTAGIRDAADKIESIGVEKTFEKVKTAALLVYLYDVQTTDMKSVQTDLEQLQHEGPLLVVANKIDLLEKVAAHQQQAIEALCIEEDNLILLSSKERLNIEGLKSALAQATFKEGINLESTIVTNARHYDALVKTDEALQQVLDGIAAGISGDMLAFDIRDALSSLGEITGQVDVDTDILGSIFGRFCIGK